MSPHPNEVNILSFKEQTEAFLSDHNMSDLLDLTVEERKVGEKFFENKWFGKLLHNKIRKTCNLQLIGDNIYDGVLMFDEILRAHLTADKARVLNDRLVIQFGKLRLKRVRDIHSFLTVVFWYFKSIKLTAVVPWSEDEKRSRLTDLLKQSSHSGVCDESNLTTALQLLVKDSGSTEEIKQSLYDLFSSEKLNICKPDLPPGFFPGHTGITDYDKLMGEVASGSSPPSLDQKRVDRKRRARKLNAEMKHEAKRQRLAAESTAGEDAEEAPADKGDKVTFTAGTKGGKGKKKRESRWDKNKK